MKQNNSTEVSGSSFLNIPDQKNLKMGGGVKHEIQIIGSPRNTKKQKVSVGNLGFYTSTLEIEIVLAPRGQNNSNFIIPGSNIYYDWLKYNII